MGISDMTLGEAVTGIWEYLWRGIAWAVCVMFSAYLLGVDWNLRVIVLCVIASFADYLFARSRK